MRRVILRETICVEEHDRAGVVGVHVSMLRFIFWIVAWGVYAEATRSKEEHSTPRRISWPELVLLLGTLLGAIVVPRWPAASVIVPSALIVASVMGTWLSLPALLLVGLVTVADFQPRSRMWLVIGLCLALFGLVFRQGAARYLMNKIGGNFARLEAKSTFRLALMSCGYFLVCWILMSVIALMSAKPAPSLSPDRFKAEAAAARSPRKQVAIALSGGGYRAALMHAGVLAGLDHYKVRLNTIASVSGGSIVGAYYVLGGSMTGFVPLVSGGQFNILNKFLNLNYPLSMIRLSTRSAQERVLDEKLYGGSTLAGARSDAGPRIMLIATDVGRGETVGLTDGGYLTRNTLLGIEPPPAFVDPKASRPPIANRPDVLAGWKSTAAGSWPGSSPIAALVSASGAFPAAFDTLDAEDMQLADGGMSDNSGMTALLDMDYFGQFCGERAAFREWKEDFVISSNAGGGFEPTWVHFNRLASAWRAIDIIYSHVEMRPLYFQRESTKHFAPPSFELNPSVLVARDWQVTEDAREIKVDFHFVYDAISALSPAERVWLAKWLGSQPAASKVTKDAMEMFADGSGDSSDLLASDLIHLDELKEDLYAFSGADTLASNYTPEAANRIFRLGFLLVALQIRSLEASLAFNRPSPPSLHICPSFR